MYWIDRQRWHFKIDKKLKTRGTYLVHELKDRDWKTRTAFNVAEVTAPPLTMMGWKGTKNIKTLLSNGRQKKGTRQKQ